MQAPLFLFRGERWHLSLLTAILSQEENWLASSQHSWNVWWLAGIGFCRRWLNIVELQHEEEEEDLGLHPGANVSNVSFWVWPPSSHLIPPTTCPNYQVTFNRYHRDGHTQFPTLTLVCYLVTRYPHIFLGPFAFVLIAGFIGQTQ